MVYTLIIKVIKKENQSSEVYHLCGETVSARLIKSAAGSCRQAGVTKLKNSIKAVN